MARYDLLCRDCGAGFKDFYYPMSQMGTDAVRCAACGSGAVERATFTFKTMTDTNFEGYWDYASGPGARYIGTRLEHRDLVATQRAKGIEVGGDYAGKRADVVSKQHDKIAKYGPGEARRQREAWQRDHDHVIHPTP